MANEQAPVLDRTKPFEAVEPAPVLDRAKPLKSVEPEPTLDRTKLFEPVAAKPVVAKQLPDLQAPAKDADTKVISETEDNPEFLKATEELRKSPPASFYKPDPPPDLDVGNDFQKSARTSDELDIDYAWLGDAPEFTDPAVNKIIASMSNVYNDLSIDPVQKEQQLDRMQQAALQIQRSNIELLEEQVEVEPDISELMAKDESWSGDVMRTMAGAGTSVMAMGNAFIKGAAGAVSIFVPKPAEEWLTENARGLSEQSAGIAEEIGKQGGLPAQIAQSVGEQCLTTAIRLATLKAVGLAGSQSIIQNAVTLGLFTATTTPGSIKERTMAGIRSATMMSTPVVAGMVPNIVLAKLVDATLNVGLSNLYGFYDWKSPGTTAEKIGRNIPSLLIDVLFASVTKPGQGAVDRRLVKKLPQMAKEGFSSYVKWRGLTRGMQDLVKAGKHGGIPAEQVAELAKKLDARLASEIDKVVKAGVELPPVTAAELAAKPPDTGLPPLKEVSADQPVLVRKAVRTSTGKVFEAQVIKKGVNKGQEEGFHGLISARIPKGELTDTMEPGYMGSDGKFYGQKEAEAIPGFLEPIGGAPFTGEDVTPTQTGVLRYFRGGADPKEPSQPAVPAIKPVQILDPARQRYIGGEKRDKAVLSERLRDLTAAKLSGITPIQLKELSGAIDKFEGSIEELSPQKLGQLLKEAKAVRPLKTEEEVARLENKRLHSYIASVLYGSYKGAAKKEQYLKDMKELGIEGEGLTDERVTREDKTRLVRLATERFPSRLPTVVTADELSANTKTINILKEMVADRKGAELIPHGPGVTMEDRSEIRNFLVEGAKKIDPEGKLTEELIDGIEYPLPRDADSRLKTLRMYQEELRGKIVAKRNADNKATRGFAQRVYHSVRDYASRKLAIDKMARDTGDYKLFAVEQLYQATKKTYQAAGNKLYDDMFKATGVDRNIISYTSDKPKLERAIKLIQGIDPNSHNKELLEARNEAVALVNNDPRGAEIIKMCDATREMLNGESAVNVRIAQAQEFGRKWDDVKQIYKELSAIPQKNAKQQKRMSRIERMLKYELPWRFNAETQKGEQVSIAEMEKAWSVLKQHNDVAARKFFRKEEWGTRDFYYMSTKNMDAKTKLRLHDIKEEPSFEASDITTTIKPAGAIEHRLGIPEFKEGSPWSGVRRHVVNMYVQAYAMDSARYIAKATDDAANNGYIDKQTAESMNKSLEVDLGTIGRSTDKLAKAMYGITRAWWTSFGLIPAKMAWYTARNILYQGVPWGAMAGQYRGADIAKAQVRMFEEWANPDSAAKRHFTEDFNDRVRLGRAVFYEGFLQFPVGEKSAYPSKIFGLTSPKMAIFNKTLGRAQELVSLMFAVSDNWNRGYTMFTGDVIIDSYIDKFVMGKINQSQLEHGLKLEALPEGHRRYLTDLFSKAKFTETDKAGNPVLRKENFKEFMRQTSELKTLLANYPYSVTERSALEQNPDTRWFWGIPVYSRGTFEVLNETISKPMARVWHNYAASGYKIDHFDAATFRTAFGNVLAQVLGRAIAMAVAGSAIGEKVDWARGLKKKGVTKGAYDIAGSIFSWGPLGPGSSNLIGMTIMAGRIAYLLRHSETEEAGKEFDKLSNAALYYLPVFPAMVPILEAAGDRRGMKNLDVIRSALNKKITGGKWKDRDTMAALGHAMFNTERMSRDNSLFERWQGAMELLGISPESKTGEHEWIEPR